jgi:hypothetical protein
MRLHLRGSRDCQTVVPDRCSHEASGGPRQAAELAMLQTSRLQRGHLRTDKDSPPCRKTSNTVGFQARLKL